MCKIKCTYVVVDNIQVRILGNGKELNLETMEALKKMIKLAHYKIQNDENGHRTPIA